MMSEPFASERVTLGKTDLSISSMGIGTWQWGDKMFWDYGKGGFTDDDLRDSFKLSLEAGIDFYDTAESYGSGRSEILLGAAVRESGQKLVVATKFMPYPWRLSRKSLVAAVRASLHRLGMEQVDIYQIHQPIPPRSPEHWADALADAHDTGLVRAVGVSNYSAEWMRRAYDTLARRGIPLASNQVEYSLFFRHPEYNGVLKACRELNISLIAYSPLAKGLLTGKYTPQHPPAGFRRQLLGRYLLDVQKLIRVMREVGDAHEGKTPSQVALNWLLCKGVVPIPGAKNARQAQENIGALGWRLTAEEVNRLEEASVAARGRSTDVQ